MSAKQLHKFLKKQGLAANQQGKGQPRTADGLHIEAAAYEESEQGRVPDINGPGSSNFVPVASQADSTDTQGVWNPCFAVQRAGEARVVPLHTPTSANLEFWEQHQHDMVLFNVGLVTQDAGQQQQQPVPINAVDLATNSEWFRALVKHLPALDGTDLGAVVVPCAVSRHILESGIVRAIYRSSVMLDAANVEAIYRAADAMQVSTCCCEAVGKQQPPGVG
eukprot:GHRR01010588.1.p1 GENE.GHRR01010588.1~~GHRR01010588.1.p1  ORF type:complete len:221 (+),score=66.56 GHRR01010588.1:187-849(+)